MDPSKRSVPEVEFLVKRGAVDEWMGSSQGQQLGFVRTVDDAKALKASILPRIKENWEILAGIYIYSVDPLAMTYRDWYSFPISQQPKIREDFKEGHPKDWTDIHRAAAKVVDEVGTYIHLMSELEQEVNTKGAIKIEGDIDSGEFSVTYPPLRVGLSAAADYNGMLVFVQEDNMGRVTIVPVKNDMFVASCVELDIAQTMFRDEAPDSKQSEMFFKAQLALRRIIQAQKNALANQKKEPVPAPGMNDAALTAEMLRLAKEAYPDWGIVKLVILESAWRPENNGAVIVHRRINTGIVMPLDGGYVMRELSFIQPYDGSKYGATKAYGIGTNEVVVDYKP